MANSPSALSPDHLSPAQTADIEALQLHFVNVFSPLPGCTALIHHDFETCPGVVVRKKLYHPPEHTAKAVEKHLEAMLEMGVIEAHNSWCIPIVLEPMTNGTLHFCVDYKGANEFSQFDAYAMPQVNIHLGRLGTFLSNTGISICCNGCKCTLGMAGGLTSWHSGQAAHHLCTSTRMLGQ